MANIDLPRDIKYDVMKASYEWVMLDPVNNNYMNKEQAEDIFYRACDFGHLERYMPCIIEEEFDLIAGESGKITRFQLLQLVKNILDKYP